MVTRKSDAEWRGTLKDGHGKMKLGSGAFEGECNQIELQTEAEIPNIDEQTFQKEAENAKANCPVSKLYKGAQISLNARLTSAQRS